MTKEEKEKILERISVSTKPIIEKGGQSTGCMQQTTIVESQDLGIRIELSYYRSSLRNKELGIEMILNTVEKLDNQIKK